MKSASDVVTVHDFASAYCMPKADFLSMVVTCTDKHDVVWFKVLRAGDEEVSIGAHFPAACAGVLNDLLHLQVGKPIITAT